mgnify:CR=1 FL=1
MDRKIKPRVTSRVKSLRGNDIWEPRFGGVSFFCVGFVRKRAGLGFPRQESRKRWEARAPGENPEKQKPPEGGLNIPILVFVIREYRNRFTFP